MVINNEGIPLKSTLDSSTTVNITNARKMSTIKRCPQMITSDHRGLRNSEVKLMWVVAGGVFLQLIKSDLVNKQLIKLRGYRTIKCTYYDNLNYAVF